MFNKRCYAAMVALVCVFSLLGNDLLSQSKTLNRTVDPVVVTGAQINEFSDVPLGELGLFAFDAASQTWTAVPFQIDEKDNQGDFVFPGSVDETSGFDSNDELVFMAADAGDRAFIWLNNPESEEHPRVEISVADPLDESQAWAYLYRSSSFGLAKLTTEDYVNYIESENPETGEDTVEGVSYKMVGNEKGLFGDLFLPNAPTTDILDGQELRGRASALFINLNFSEDDLAFLSVAAIDGAVRVVRRLTLDLLGELSVPLPALYYGSSIAMGGTVNIPSDIDYSGISVNIREIRHSMNLSSAVSGFAYFSSANNKNVLIDGNFDNVSRGLVFDPEINYTHIAGQQSALAKGAGAFQGTIVTLFSIPNTIGDSQELFYDDDAGDGNYGDSGVIVEGDDIEGEFPLAFNLTFFDDNQDVLVASQLKTNAENPLATSFETQDITTVPVELVAFTATVSRNQVQLNWVTATETNNFGFDVERKTPGSDNWTRIGFVRGQGTTTVLTQYSFSDTGLQPGVYEYRLRQVDTDGGFEYTDAITAVVGLPETFVLQQNFPNPFNPETEIHYELPALRSENAPSSRAVLKIYNMLGQEIRTLVDGAQAPGYHSVTWDGRDALGNRVPSGVYLYRMRFGQFSETRKMVLVQ